MNRNFKRMFANVLRIVAILVIAFPVTGSAYAQSTTHKVGLIAEPGSLFDNAFNLMAIQGLEWAEAELGISTLLYYPDDQSEYGAVLQQCADDGNELCIAVSFTFGVSLANAARDNPDTEWAIIDYSYPDCWDGAEEGTDCGSFTEIPNVQGLKFNEKEVGYLAGVLAGRMTTSDNIGAVGGMDIPPVAAFIEGYRNGAQCVNPEVNVLTTYTGTFDDPDLGANTAQDMIAQGADIIFGVAGRTGNGAILFSAQNGQWAIGVDSDQYLTVFGEGSVDGADRLLSSAMKHVDNAVYQTIEDYVNGEFTSGTVIYDLAADGVGLAPFHETESSIPQEVKDELNAVKQGIIDGNINIDTPCPWHDEFDGALADGWYWVNENPDKWSFNDGFLRIYTSPYPSGGENLLLRSVAEGDFSIETRMFFTPDTNFQIAGLVIWQDAENFLQFGRAFCYFEGAPCVGNGIYFDKVLEGAGDPTNFATQIDNPFDPAEAYLRLERRGDMVRALYSHEGITWTEIGTHQLPPEGFHVNGVGLTSAQDFNTPDWDIPADFDYFELTEGWGFLPEGFHDYDGGDVPTWACNAGGWAVDPDNREADIAVEVNVDGTSYFANASEYREDLDNAGVCVDGKCGFAMSLWDAITSYEMHNITAYAQDIESGEWVRLYNSPKELTCRTYDIYAYDPLTGGTKPITNLPDFDEYNPSWSPNGKKVVHDVVAADESLSGIYITDVKTGVSTKLADVGGNDAVWSPNGKWIVFDRAWDEIPSLYLVPATGGTPTLVKEYAISADWAPNGKRLVFQGTTDGSVRTIAVDGGKGGETTVAPLGWNPVWSPDGNWIAYDVDGDIWKVQVNIQGTPLGEPIQMTSGPFLDGQPTWSPDSTTIVYHSGFNDDWDLWSVPAAGGTPTWLTGAVVFGDYDPAYAKNSPTVGYASFSPNGQAERTWVAAFTYDAGTWDAGTHTYQFWIEGAPNGEEFSFDVSSDNPLYDGFALIRPWTLRAQTPDGCANIAALHPAQETRFHIGWTFDGIYSDALTYYEKLMAQVRWDTTEPADMLRHEIFPLTAPVDWFGHTCTFTAGPPAPTIITVWHQWSGDYLTAITEVFNQYMAEHPDVWIGLFKPDDMPEALAAAIPAGEGPDIIGGANDQIGTYAENGFIVPLDDLGVDMAFLEGAYEPAAVTGVVWQNQIWGLPESQEAITLVYNKDIASESDFPSDPLNFADLLAKAQAYYEANNIPLFCNQGFSGFDAYHVAPAFFGFDSALPNYVDEQGVVHVNTPEKVAAGVWLASIKPYLLLEMKHEICRDALLNGQVAAWWTGPWAIADLEANGVDYGFVTMGKPFVGIKTLMLSSNATDRDNAEVALDIMKFFTGYDMQKYMTLANKTIPANTAALNDPDVQALASIAGFGANANIGAPMANTPYQYFQWGPVGEAVYNIWSGMTPAVALAAAQAAIEEAIAAMNP